MKKSTGYIPNDSTRTREERLEGMNFNRKPLLLNILDEKHVIYLLELLLTSARISLDLIIIYTEENRKFYTIIFPVALCR